MRRLLIVALAAALFAATSCTPDEVQLWFRHVRGEEITWEQAVAVADITNRPACDPNYEWECIPPGVSDADCSSGSGNGPHYVHGQVKVVGRDIHGLDRDGDGIGCERG